MSDFTFPKKKKKRSFFQHIKHNGKKGNYGKGKQLSEEEYSYYIRLMDQLRSVDKSEKDVLVSSFFREIKKDDKLKELASNQIVSRILDDVLPCANIEDFLMLIEEFAKDLRIIFTDPFASHVLQTLLNQGFRRCRVNESLNKEESEEDSEVLGDEDRSNLLSFLVKTSKFALNNLEEFMADTYASHVVRSVFEVTSGVPLANNIKNSQNFQGNHKLNDQTKTETKTEVPVPRELKEIFKMFVKRFIDKSTQNMSDVATNKCSSAVAQGLIIIAKDLKKSKELTEAVSSGIRTVVLEDNGACMTSLHPVFYSSPALRLLEVLYTHSTRAQQTKLYSFFFEGHLKELIEHPNANISVQVLIREWKNTEAFDELFGILDTNLLQIAFNERRFGIMLALVETCGRLESNQNECIKKLMRLLNCLEPPEDQLLLGPLLIRMITKGHYHEFKESYLPTIEKQGTLIAQELLKYKNSAKIVNSILAMSPNELEELICDPKGSHIIDAFITSPSIGEKSKFNLVDKFKERTISIALSKHGSYCLEQMFKISNVKTKTWICRELSENENRIKEDKIGVIIYNNLQVRLFKRKDKSDWETLVKRQDKKRQLLHDIMESAGTGAKKIKGEKIKEES